MIAPGTGVRVSLACGVTDMRKGIAGLSALTQDVLRQKPTGGAVLPLVVVAGIHCPTTHVYMCEKGLSCCIGMVRDFAFITKFWNGAGFPGPLLWMVRRD
jgi:hypothetical protein